MKFPFSNWFSRSSEKPAVAMSPVSPINARTGSVLHPVRVLPDEAAFMRRMFETSASLMRDVGELNGKMVRSYDAAMTSAFNTDFKGTYGSPNAEIMTSDYPVRARCRTIAKDHPHGKAIVRAYKNNVVGHDPFRLTMRVGKWEVVENVNAATGKKTKAKRFVEEEELNRAVEEQWILFGRRENFSIKQDLSRLEAFLQIQGSGTTVGGALMRLHRDFPRNKFKFAVNLLETDRLQTSYMGTSEDGNPIRFSVERDPNWGYPLYYYLLTRHPGEIFANNYPGGDRKVMRERVLAREIIHYNNLRERPEQEVGFTELDAVVQSMHHNAQYNRALTLAAVASCCKPFVIEKDLPTGLQYQATYDELANLFTGNNTSPSGAGNDGQSTGNTVARQQGNPPSGAVMSPAMTQVLEWGFRMKVLDPKFPIEAASEFRKDNLKDIATGAGISYSALTGDFQSLGYIAAQMSKQPERDQFMVLQEHFIDTVVRPLFKEWLRSSIMNGVFDDLGLDLPLTRLDELVSKAYFKGKRWPFTDELREVQALVLKKQNRLLSPQQAQNEMRDGKDYEDVIAEIATATECEESHGLPPLAGDPTRPDEGLEDPDEVDDGGDGGKPKAGGVGNVTKKPA